MIQKALIDILFQASHMKRWTDRVRPTDFTVLGKEAHALSAAWILGKQYEVKNGSSLNWPLIVEVGIFSVLEKCVLSDIKYQVFNEFLDNEDVKEALATHVLQVLENPVGDVNRRLFERFRLYLENGREEQKGIEYDILRASSWLANNWEWCLIENWGDRKVHSVDEPHESIKESFKCVEPWAKQLSKGNKDVNDNLTKLWDLCGRLRFQDRWTQTPVIPRRTVLDHELIVGTLAYLAFMDIIPREDDKPKGNDPIPEIAHKAAKNFFVGLFHDMAEVTTRDIISPVKSISPVVNQRIEDLERNLFNEAIAPLIDDNEWKKEFEGYVLRPFDEDTIFYNGRSIKGCDVFAAFMEAFYSVKCGTYSPWLREALLQMFEHRRQYSPKNVGAIDFNGVDFEVVYELCFHDVEHTLRTIG